MTTKIKLSTNVADVDVTTTAPTDGQSLVYSTSSSKWIPGAAAGGGVTVYSTIDDLPLTGMSTGDLALVDSTNKLYLWMDTGWYNIATINTSPSITGGNETPYILATDGTPTEITLVASDPEGIPLTWSYEVTSGSLTNGGGTTATVSNVDNVFTVTPTTTEAYAGAFSLTFKASDGVNIGTSVAAFTLVFNVLDSHYTTLLAKGTAATQNATFVDSSTNAHTITRNGDTYQGTFSPYRSGGYSLSFDGTGDYISCGAKTIPASGDFTVEGFFLVNSLPTRQDLINQYTSTSTAGRWAINLDSSGNVIWFMNGMSGAGLITSTATATVGEWVHFAAVRASNTFTLYINGTQSGTPTTGTQTVDQGRDTAIGYLPGNTTAGGYFDGYITNIRVVSGTAVYTSNFTPPTEPLTAITNTSLLLNTPYIADSSSNAHAITVNGNTSTKPFGPFDYKKYNATDHGANAYFDGSTDYLTIPTNSSLGMGSGDFTVEFWLYKNSFSGSVEQVLDVFDANSSGRLILWFGTSGQLSNLGSNGSTRHSTASGAIKLGQWQHIVLVRYSGISRFYINGVQSGSDYSDSTNYTCTTGNVFIGINADGSTYPTLGYISGFRMVKGTAVYTAAFTPPTAPLTAITNTSLLLNCTNAGVQDYSQVSDLKLVGNATGSSTQVKNASYSMYFDGTGDYLTVEPSDGFKFGTGDFTVEGWIYLTGVNATANGIFQIGTSYFPATNSNTLAFSTINQNNFQIYAADGTHFFNPAVAPSLNTWYHFAVVRSGGTTKAYINGVVGISISDTRNYTGTYFGIGNIYGFNGYTQNGYIEDLRVTKGLARYTANFTPPTSELLG